MPDVNCRGGTVQVAKGKKSPAPFSDRASSLAKFADLLKRAEIDRGSLAAPVHFKLELEPITFVE